MFWVVWKRLLKYISCSSLSGVGSGRGSGCYTNKNFIENEVHIFVNEFMIFSQYYF